MRSKGIGRGGFEWSPRLLALVVGLAVLIGLGIGLGIAFSGGGKSTSAANGAVDFSRIPGLQNDSPPWQNGSSNLPDKLAIVRLNSLPSEGSALHIHQHLDLFVKGQHVAVPANVGIFDNTFLTEIHTHDASGIIHVESPKKTTYRLGQFFGEWGVRLSASCVGKFCGGLHWWVDGKQQTGNPADLALKEHQEIVIAVGKPPAHIPSTYNFAAHGV